MSSHNSNFSLLLKIEFYRTINNISKQIFLFDINFIELLFRTKDVENIDAKKILQLAQLLRDTNIFDASDEEKTKIYARVDYLIELMTQPKL